MYNPWCTYSPLVPKRDTFMLLMVQPWCTTLKLMMTIILCNTHNCVPETQRGAQQLRATSFFLDVTWEIQKCFLYSHIVNNNASQFFLRPTHRNFLDIKGRFLIEKQTRIKTRRFTFFGCFYMYPLISGLFSTPQGVYLFHVTIWPDC